MDYKQIAVINERKLKAKNEELKAKVEQLQEQKEQVEEIIDYVLADNRVNIMDAKQYIRFVQRDIEYLEDLKDNGQIDEQLFNHIFEELELLKDIITIIKGV